LAQPSESEEFLLVLHVGELESCYPKEGAKVGADVASGLGSEPHAGHLQAPARMLLRLLNFMSN